MVAPRVSLAILAITKNNIATTYAGMKFWKTGKIVKAISEADHQKLQKSRGKNDPGPSNVGLSNPGPSSSGLSKPPTLFVSDSDSDGQIIPLVRKRKKIFHIPSPSGSDSDFSPAPHEYDRTHAITSMEKMLKDVITIAQDGKGSSRFTGEGDIDT